MDKSFNARPQHHAQDVVECVVASDHTEVVEELAKASERLFESHCLNAGHSAKQTCPICVNYCAAINATKGDVNGQ